MFHRTSTVALLVALGLTIAGGTVWANTIAESAKSQTLAFESTLTLLAGLEEEDVCVTIVNRSDKTGLIEVTLTDSGMGTSTSQIAKSKSSALCGVDTDSISLECLGPKKCAFTWNVSRF